METAFQQVVSEPSNGPSTPRPQHPHVAEEAIVPGEAYEYAIEMWPTSNVFRRGHRIRLEVIGSEAVAPMMMQPNLQPPSSNSTVLEEPVNPSHLLFPGTPGGG